MFEIVSRRFRNCMIYKYRQKLNYNAKLVKTIEKTKLIQKKFQKIFKTLMGGGILLYINALHNQLFY